MDDETFATESEPWVTVHNNRRRRNIAIAGILIVVASVGALVLGVTLYDRGGISNDASSRNSGFGSGEYSLFTDSSTYSYASYTSTNSGANRIELTSVYYRENRWAMAVNCSILQHTNIKPWCGWKRLITKV